MKRIIVFMIVVLNTLMLHPSQVLSSGDSIVIGRITGTYQPLPGYFYNHPYVLATGFKEVEFTGFRLIRKQDGKKFTIRPNHGGFFFQKLPEGQYTLTRKRNDRPGYREPGTIEIIDLEVKQGTMVNLGTLAIVLDGPPDESLISKQNSSRGVYTYRYRYDRIIGDDAYDRPLAWFRQKKPETASSFGDRVELNRGIPSEDRDGSKKVLRFRVPHSDR